MFQDLDKCIHLTSQPSFCTGSLFLTEWQNVIFFHLHLNYFLQSTGDSLDDEDDEDLMEAKKNTSYNEVIDADNPQTPAEVSKHVIYSYWYSYYMYLHMYKPYSPCISWKVYNAYLLGEMKI